MTDNITDDDLNEMEGFFVKKKKSGLFFQVFDGSICLKSPTFIPNDDWDEEPVKTVNPQTKAEVFNYVKRFDNLIARVVDCEQKKKEFETGGKAINVNFKLRAGKKRAILATTYMEAMLKKLLKVAPNIDFSKPIMFGAFKRKEQGKSKQYISIRQGGTTAEPDSGWEPVPFYWTRPLGADNKVDYSKPAKGKDGTVMPDSVHDEDEDTWDSKEQNKFLMRHFVENTLPRIKAIAKEMGLSDDSSDGDETPEYTGTASEAKAAKVELPIVTKRPDDAEVTSPSTAMTAEQATMLKKLAKQVNKDPDALSQKFVELDADDLSINGAAYVIYKIQKRIAKAREADPTAFPEPVAESKIKEQLQTEAKAKAPANDDEDDDGFDWSEGKQTTKPAQPDDDDDDDMTF